MRRLDFMKQSVISRFNSYFIKSLHFNIISLCNFEYLINVRILTRLLLNHERPKPLLNIVKAAIMRSSTEREL